MTLNVLITGAHGDIATSCTKVLKDSDLNAHVFGIDASDTGPGFLFFNQIFQVPRCLENKEEYLKEIKNIIIKNQIKVLIPCTEAEMKVLMGQRDLIKNLGVSLIMSDNNILNVGFDKLKTVQLLKENNLPAPWTSIVSKEEPYELPCILKPRYSSGSRQIYIPKTKEDKEYLEKLGDDFVWQELLSDDDAEYTCGLYKDDNFSSFITLKRVLRHGLTVYAYRSLDKEIEKYLQEFIEKIDFRGSINIQLRKNNNTPVTFEINPRLSSTLLYRHKLGFQDLIWAIKNGLGEQANYTNEFKKDLKFYRFFTEEIV